MTNLDSKNTRAGSAALGVLLGLRDIWVDTWGLGQESDFYETMFDPMASNPETNGAESMPMLELLAKTSTREVTEELQSKLKPENAKNFLDAKSKMTDWLLFETALAFAIQAFRAQSDKASLDTQWGFAIEAKYCFGKLEGMISYRENQNPGAALAKRGADARHAENRAMKAQLFEWCAEHLLTFKSMDAAAYAVVQTEIPVRFRTARLWIAEWKKLQSASTL